MNTFPEYIELDADAVYKAHRGNLISTILEIVEKEAPISGDYLLKRVAKYFKRERVTAALWAEFLMLTENNYRLNSVFDIKDFFIYLKKQNTFIFRIPGAKRKIEYIPVEELAQGFFVLIQQNVTITKEGLFKVMNGLLGYSRTGGNLYFYYNNALRRLVEKGLVKQENEVYTAISQMED